MFFYGIASPKPFWNLRAWNKQSLNIPSKIFSASVQKIISCNPILTLWLLFPFHTDRFRKSRACSGTWAARACVCWGCRSTWRRYLLCVCQETLKVQSFSLAQIRLSRHSSDTDNCLPQKRMGDGWGCWVGVGFSGYHLLRHSLWKRWHKNGCLSQSKEVNLGC